MNPDDRKYSKEHEWVKLEDAGAGLVLVGITEYAQDQLGDIVYVELPGVGANLEKGAEAAVVESVKAVSELCAPVGGKVIAVNESLADSPEQINASPYADGWMAVMECPDVGEFAELLDADAYRAYVAERDDPA